MAGGSLPAGGERAARWRRTCRKLAIGIMEWRGSSSGACMHAGDLLTDGSDAWHGMAWHVTTGRTARRHGMACEHAKGGEETGRSGVM